MTRPDNPEDTTVTETPFSDLTSGDLVTVTYHDGVRSQPRIWHGVWRGIAHVETHFEWQSHRYTHIICGGPAPSTREWISVGTRWSQTSFDPQGLDKNTENVICGVAGLRLRADLPGLTVTAITDAGRAHLADTEPSSDRRERLIERFRELDPAAADELDRTIDALIDTARADGEHNARREDW